ncbi:MAG TPA: SDR family oxidoreductase [Gaiellales bacterium]|jgi:NAD(P)-dependent dehydrogenase (short-subunit alcohol dehydrogenase family)|nr:SDR family oxidoreductase [Gaiellales bacterium]
MSPGARVALVTGASRGIGRAVATRLADTGYRVAIAARSESEIAQVADELGAHALTLDVADSAAVEQAIATVERELGPLSLLVNNAGTAGDSGFSWEQSPDRWWEVFEVNVLGTFLCCRAALPHMRARGHGRIVNIASNAAFFRFGQASDGRIGSAYMASKAAVIRFSDALAAEARPGGVHVFAISPGTVKTEMTATIFEAEWDEEEFWSPPELTAELIEFLETGALDALSGRYIHAANDDWRAFPERIPALLAEDALALRVR